jgi:hypothetical protein
MHGMTRWPVAKPKLHPHLVVIKALQARDGAMARAAIQQDIEMSTEALRRYLTSHTEQPEWARQSLRPADPAARSGADRTPTRRVA